MHMSRYSLIAVFAMVSCAPCAHRLVAQEKPKSAVGPLLNILQRDLPPDRVAFILDIIAQKGNAYDLGVVYAKAMDENRWRGENRLAALKALAAAARNRKVHPEGELSKLSTLINADTAARSPPAYELAIELAGLWSVGDLADELGALATGKETSTKHRQSALQALVEIGGDPARDAIATLTRDEQPQALRYQGAAALARLDLTEAAPLAVTLLAGGTVKDDPAVLVDAFLDQQGGTEKLAAALEESEQRISADVAKLALRHMFSIGRSDQALVDALSHAAGISTKVEPPTAEEMKSLIADVEAKGDAQRGESIFRRADLNCLKCHAINGAGGNVGPDLVDLGGRQSLDYLIESVLVPEKAVKEEYQLAQVTDYLSGKRHQGIVQEESDERIVLKDANGQQIIVNIEDPEEIEVRKGGSLMPQGLARFLTRDEIVDLVKFLSVLGRPETKYAKNTAPLARRWRLLQEVPDALLEAVPDDEAFLDHVQTAEPTEWSAAYSLVDGRLPIDQLADKASPIVFVQAELDVAAAGEIGIEIAGCEDLMIWVDEVRQKSQPRFVVFLEKGRHTITLRADGRKCDPAGLMVRMFAVDGSAGEAAFVNMP